MKASMSLRLFVFSVLLVLVPLATSDTSLDRFLKCLPSHSDSSYPVSRAIYRITNSSFEPTLRAYAKASRFLTSTTPKPLAIIAATHESHVQATVICAKSNGLQIRIRSGGHDYEGLSYVSNVPFVILDTFNLRSIDIDVAGKTAWIQSGATTGELYYNIANKSNVLAFPAGVCLTLGAGGHFSGGGYGPLMRKHGLSIDNIFDAKIVDVNGKILDRKSMGEDLFWAIRGGGGASFGVILSWKISLVDVPPKVTTFTVSKTLEQGATDVVYRWQEVASKLDKELFIRVMPRVVDGSSGSNKTVRVSFIGLFLGPSCKLLPLMKNSFPELGLQQKDCNEMSWVESTLYWFGLPNGTSIETLLDRPTRASFFKRKSDYVQKAIPKKGLEKIWKTMIKVERVWMQWNPYGGRMDEIPATATAFPHRAGNLFKIQYSVDWSDQEGIEAANHYIDLITQLYDTMTPYVSSNPREAFLNYRDVDIGSNPSNQTSFEKAKVYGNKLFKNNFIRLVKVKSRVDPDDFFKYEQSIPASLK
ncbi:PREDICTED: reticuline oxidase-like protein [Populus euphratica]|uniref:Reticuline oxidase-like protein n=1 Tax=Populus euphratica TaxID=75702 RepID=A0AAJ6Y318_POPEU|nr:PREDICTED: reticuline oxidase-like protein [Populus euphratica]